MTTPEAAPGPMPVERPLNEALDEGHFSDDEREALQIILDHFGDGTMLVEGEGPESDQVIVEIE